MVRFLIARPIAVSMSFVALVVFSIMALRQLPVSLLPSVDVPSIVVKVNYPNASPGQVEENVLRNIRQSLATLNGLQGMESKASSEAGQVSLQFAFGTDMDLAYIETNEKIDQLTDALPQGMPRPQVVKLNTSDIPIVRIQVVPTLESDYLAIAGLADKVLKKRIEQLNGVSLVDINGLQRQVLAISPRRQELQAYGLGEEDLIRAVEANNRELAALWVKDGHYRYSLKVSSRLTTLNDLAAIPVRTPEGQVLQLSRLAKVAVERERPQGFHLFNRKAGMVITVHKQAKAKMNDLVPQVYEAVDLFAQDFPNVEFALTQDQSQLLNTGISNLQTSLLFGGLFAFAVIFLFMGNYRTPLIIGISLPSSLLISFLVFYATGLSINIISLSGLALGLGMLIDNAIIVLDNISRKRAEGLALVEAAVQGVNEVITPLISSVLTTLAVFVPLVFLNGLSGALFYDQAVAVAAILGVSLLVSFVLLPLVYRLLYRKAQGNPRHDSRLFLWVLKAYKGLFNAVWRAKGPAFVLLLLFIPATAYLGLHMPTAGLPPIEKRETLLTLQWNEPMDVAENRDRVVQLLGQFADRYTLSESEVGIQQFLMATQGNELQNATVYFLFESQAAKVQAEAALAQQLASQYPLATYRIEDAPNAFDQLFASNLPYLEARFKSFTPSQPIAQTLLFPMVSQVPQAAGVPAPQQGEGLVTEAAVKLNVAVEKLRLYNVTYQALLAQVQRLFSDYNITDIRSYGEVTPILLKEPTQTFEQKLRNSTIKSTPNAQGQVAYYSLAEFISFEFVTDYKHLTADRTGLFHALRWKANPGVPIENLTQRLRQLASANALSVSFVGQYFENQENLQQLLLILLISVLLLYFILAAQFESFLQPLIVVFTLPLGIGGALLLLLATGGSLNVMSAIGMVVMLGIMVNDAILKIDTINRLSRENLAALSQHEAQNQAQPQPITKAQRRAAVAEAIHRTSAIRLKPILMTSVTTILALLPIIFSSGLGADLQRPLVFAVMGGLTIGTFTALFFIPLAYWFLVRK